MKKQKTAAMLLAIILSMMGCLTVSGNSAAAADEDPAKETAEQARQEGGIKLMGDAKTLKDGSIQLTPEKSEKAGSAWLPELFSTGKGLTVDFSCYTGNDFGGNGLVLMFSGSKGLGDSGEGLGFVEGAAGIEFDPCDDENFEGKHVAVIQGQVINHISRRLNNRVSDSRWHTVRVLYKPGYLAAYMDGREAVHAVGITLPDKVYIGASASTGEDSNRHLIKDLAAVTGSGTFPDTNGWKNEGVTSCTITYHGTEGSILVWDEDKGDYIWSNTCVKTPVIGTVYNPDLIIPEHPKGKMFIGWSLSENGEVLNFTENITAREDTDYFAIWGSRHRIEYKAGQDGYFEEWAWDDETGKEELNRYTEISEDIGEGSILYSCDYPWPDTDDDTKEFIGWSLTGDGDPIGIDGYKVTGDLTVYAVWGDPCTVTWDANGGHFEVWKWDEDARDYNRVPVDSNTVRFGQGKICAFQDQDIPYAPEGDYSFKGWALSRDGEPVSEKPFQVTGDITFYALWEETEY